MSTELTSADSFTAVPGMGAIPLERGVAFRVWAPHAGAVSVAGSFNDFDGSRHPLRAEENGCWYTEAELSLIHI